MSVLWGVAGIKELITFHRFALRGWGGAARAQEKATAPRALE